MKRNIKKSFSIFLSAIILILSFSVVAFADDESTMQYKVSNGYATLVSCGDANGIVVVPQITTINGNGYYVNTIGEGAFENCDDITSIYIPEGVTVVKSRAFADCDSLTDVYVPSTLTSCQYDVFDDCGEITVHCYSSNYQFFTVYGTTDNIKIRIVDAEAATGSNSIENQVLHSVIEVIKRLFNQILALFGIYFK